MDDGKLATVAEAANPSSPGTSPLGEIPRAVFDDMGLRVGDRMQLAPPASIRGEPCIVRLIGYVRELSLIVSAPPIGCWQPPVIEGDNVVMRVFSGRSAFGFVSRVDRIIKLPFDYLHLSFPRAIAGRVIRRSRRVKCDIPAAVDGAPVAAGTISNLSSTGAQICTDAALGEPGQTVGLSFTVRVRDADLPVALKAEIRSAHVAAGEGKTLWRSGLEFEDVPAAASAALKTLIYQELIERPQSLL